jgi:hypothetical protein
VIVVPDFAFVKTINVDSLETISIFVKINQFIPTHRLPHAQECGMSLVLKL